MRPLPFGLRPALAQGDEARLVSSGMPAGALCLAGGPAEAGRHESLVQSRGGAGIAVISGLDGPHHRAASPMALVAGSPLWPHDLRKCARHRPSQGFRLRSAKMPPTFHNSPLWCKVFSAGHPITVERSVVAWRAMAQSSCLGLWASLCYRQAFFARHVGEHRWGCAA